MHDKATIQALLRCPSCGGQRAVAPTGLVCSCGGRILPLSAKTREAIADWLGYAKIAKLRAVPGARADAQVAKSVRVRRAAAAAEIVQRSKKGGA